MQTNFRKQIMPSVNLTCIESDKFKTGYITVVLMSELDKKTASRNAVLPRVLRRGTSRYPNMESISAVLDDLYGARISPIVKTKGEIQCFGFACDFIDDKWTDDGKILEGVTSLLGEMLLSPSTAGGRLVGEYVESEREKLIEDIRAELNDKRQYAISRLKELMCSTEGYGVNCLGSISAAEKITVSTLTKHYRQVIAASPIEIFYCGSANPNRVERAMIDAFSSLPRSAMAMMPHTELKIEPLKPQVRYFNEQFDVAQGKLAIGFRMGEPMLAPNYAAIMVCNAVFGGCVTSKLFMNVREKLSLCYYAGSAVEKHKGVMLVSSGIEVSNYDVALNEITAQLEAVKNGEIEQWELDGAKNAMINALRSVSDRQAAVCDFYLDGAVSGMGCSPDDMAVLVSFVTKEEVMKVASGIKIDTVYFLSGSGEGDNNDD